MNGQVQYILPVKELFGQKVVLSNVVAELLKTASLVDHFFAHEARHAGDTVDADEIDEQVHPAVACAKVDFLESAGEPGPITDERHLMNEAHFFSHETHHVVQRILGH